MLGKRRMNNSSAKKTTRGLTPTRTTSHFNILLMRDATFLTLTISRMRGAGGVPLGLLRFVCKRELMNMRRGSRLVNLYLSAATNERSVWAFRPMGRIYLLETLSVRIGEVSQCSCFFAPLSSLGFRNATATAVAVAP